MKRITCIVILLVSMVYGQEINNAEPSVSIVKLEKRLQEKETVITRLREELENERQENKRLRQLCKAHGIDDRVEDYISGERKARSHISRNAQSLNNQQRIDTIPSLVHRKIRQKAESKWPDDYEMQKYTIENELEAYRSLQNMSYSGVSKKKYLQIRRNAQAKWPDDYEMQKYTIENQLGAYRSLDSNGSNSQKANKRPGSNVPSKILNRIQQVAKREYPDSYSVQEMLIKSEIDAYIFIQNYDNEQVPRRILNNIKQTARREYPGSYSVQKMLIESEIESYLNLND